jgi:hypothetical protein
VSKKRLWLRYIRVRGGPPLAKGSLDICHQILSIPADESLEGHKVEELVSRRRPSSNK